MPQIICTLALLTATVIAAYPLLRKTGTKGFYLLALALLSCCALLLQVVPEVTTGAAIRHDTAWISAYGINLALRVDLTAALLAVLVTGAGALVLSYCGSYFQPHDKNIARFGVVFVGFAASMLGLVIADNVYLLFMFWEATTVLSFLLIAHSGKKRASRAAAQQALIITTAGGLAMLVGFILLHTATGSANLSQILAQIEQNSTTTVAVYLLLAGALSKSAIFPTHFWLPQAMAAPTPVSAYLHAAAMVKAGIYLLARLSSAEIAVPGYTAVLVTLGAITMLLGAIKALKQYDLKLILAYGTVSQLGMLTMLYGVAHPVINAAATLLLFAHAFAKAPLFLTVGIIEQRTGSRDIRKINGLWRKEKLLAGLAGCTVFSMIGGIPFIGFVAKEAAFAELLLLKNNISAAAALTVIVLGSCLTTAYMLRFLAGAFGQRKNIAVSTLNKRSLAIMLPVAVFVLLTLAGGVFAAQLDVYYQNILGAQLKRAELAGTSVISAQYAAAHLALWHGVTPALLLSCAVLAAGVMLVPVAGVWRTRLPLAPEKYSFSAFYFAFMRQLNRFAVQLTTLTQRGSLPYYIAVILVVAAGTIGGLLLWVREPFAEVRLGTPAELVIAVVLSTAAIATVFAKKRFQAVILVGFTGFAMAVLYGLSGAPDLALTQMLVEAITLIAFVLVIRRLPQHLALREVGGVRILQILIGVAIALVLGAVTLTAMAARTAEPVSELFAELAVTGGHGHNVVNVTLVDIRGWDTFGELSVVVVAATGIASLVFLSARADNLPKLSRKKAKDDVLRHLRRLADPNDPASRSYWMIAGRDLSPERRSIILEVVVRLLFHALLVLSIYMLLAGHNSPGGGFAGGLVAGMALVSRYLVGGRSELGATVPFDAGKIVGAGLLLSALTAILPLFFGAPALFSSWVDLHLGLWGTVPLVTSTLFDIGVYLVVFGLVLDVLRSLGAQIDVHSEQERQVMQ